MAEFSLEDICKAVNGKVANVASERFSGVTTDTRKVKPGDMFIALQGEHFDGHDFVLQAITNGASGVIVRNSNYVPSESKVSVVVVADTLKALQDLARFHRMRFDIPIIAITGSNGKTTTKDMIAAVLTSKYSVLKTEANYNNEIGLPLTLLNLNSDHEVAIVEMGMRGLGQIRELTNIAMPNIAVITNVGETHMELLGSIENIAIAKGELVDAIPSNGLVVLNADNKYVRNMKEKTIAKVLCYGIEEECETSAFNIRQDDRGTTFSVRNENHIYEVVLPALGRHNVYNALAAITIGFSLNLRIEDINYGFSKFVASDMRLSIVKLANYTVINDAYNASPLSTEAAIDTLMQIAKERKVAVLGDMLELGEFAVEAHRKVGYKLAELGFDVVVTVGELSRHIAQAASEGGCKYTKACATHEEAKLALDEYLQANDTILLKGSRGMRMEKILEMLR